MEFFIETEPDIEDLFEDGTDFDRLPELALVTSSDDSSDSSDSEDGEEMAEQPRPAAAYSGGFRFRRSNPCPPGSQRDQTASERESPHVEPTQQPAMTQETISNKETCDGKLREAPTVTQAFAALKDLKNVLNPPRKKGPGHVDPELNIFVRT